MSSFWRKVITYAPSVLLDIGLAFICYLFALLLRFDWEIPDRYLIGFRQSILLWALIYCGFNYLFGLYKHMWRYASAQEVITIFESVAASTALVSVGILLSLDRPLPLSVVVTGGIFTMGGFTVVRYRFRLVTGLMWRWSAMMAEPGKRLLIVGAGEVGQLLAWRLKHQTRGYDVVGFIDDDPKKQGMKVHGVKVLGTRHDIARILDSEKVDMVVLAIHKISSRDYRAILSICLDTSAQVKVLPNIFSLMDGKAKAPLLRDITIEDITGREPAEIDLETCQKLIGGKVILVTGGGGSIGSELCRQISKLGPRLLLVIDNNETSLHDLKMELFGPSKKAPLKAIVSDILREDKMENIFSSYRPEIVFHCAAYKHVPLMEEYPDEAVWVNVVGVRILYELASKYKVERFVFMSTDKAVDPSSVMGASKRIGELLVNSLPEDRHTRFTAVRFGNVLNSRGSVIPTFLKQIEMGGPVTVTDPEMARFFLGIPEAVSLILQAAAFTRGGDIFMLDMGEEMKIVDLAHKMIRMQGLRVGKDIQIVFTGARPGEKLNEELLAPHLEEKVPTPHPRIFRVQSNHSVARESLLAQINALAELAYSGEKGELVKKLKEVAGCCAPAPLADEQDGLAMSSR